LTASNPGKRSKKKHEYTEVFYEQEAVMDKVLRFLHETSDTVDACVDYTRPSLAINIPFLRKAFLNAKKRGVRLRYVTEITKDNISHCKRLLSMVDELRHLDGIKGNFYISENAYLAPATYHEKGKPAKQIIYSNVNEIVKHQRFVFDSFWNRATPAEQRIKDIVENREPEFYEVINDSGRASQILLALAQSAKKEALLLLPNDKSILRLERLGVIDTIINASNIGADVKIICPQSEENSETIRKISENAPAIKILSGSDSPYGMYIVDGERFIRAELKNPDAEKFSESVGFMIYSNRKNTVESFKSIFELLWNEHRSTEELKRAYRMQKEFINIASHEMKTPTQSIIGYAELLRQHPERRDQMIQAISRNALRLQRLTNNILDVTRIESQTLNLHKEQFNLGDLISVIVEDHRRQIDQNKNNVRILHNIRVKKKNTSLIVYADRGRLTQVLSNLLSNAIKFTLEKKEKGQVVYVSASRNDQGEVIVSVKDSGEGIDPDMFPRLFTKFVTKSFTGTGLGLFISKSIVEAHGGKIWAKNNGTEKGATFTFTLPIKNKEKAGVEIRSPGLNVLG
jgi:two-component system, OmpR family, sensor histidine kinase VicK